MDRAYPRRPRRPAPASPPLSARDGGTWFFTAATRGIRGAQKTDQGRHVTVAQAPEARHGGGVPSFPADPVAQQAGELSVGPAAYSSLDVGGEVGRPNFAQERGRAGDPSSAGPADGCCLAAGGDGRAGVTVKTVGAKQAAAPRDLRRVGGAARWEAAPCRGRG